MIFKIPRIVNYVINSSYNEECIGEVLNIETDVDRRIVQRAERLMEVGLKVTFSVNFGDDSLTLTEYISRGAVNQLTFYEIKGMKKGSDIVLYCREGEFKIKVEK